LNTNSYSEVAVKRAEVKLYGSGQLSEKELLSSLELKTGGVEDGSDATVTVGPGPMQIDRIMLSARLAKLEEQGSSVKDLRQLFEQLEATAKSEDKAGTAAQVKDLRLKVGDREKALSQARRHENYLDAKVQRRAQFSQNGNLQSTGGGQNQSDKGTPPHADQSNEASGIPHEWTRAYVNALLLNPVNKKPMYNFVVDDLPKPKPGSGYFALISCLIGIQNKVKSGQNVDGFVKSMNDVMSSQINHGRDYKERLHQLLGRLSQSSPAQTGADRRSPNRLPSPPY
jgi:hypothetical protein